MTNLLNWKIISVLSIVQLSWILLLNLVNLLSVFGLALMSTGGAGRPGLNWWGIVNFANILTWAMYFLPVLLFSWWGYSKSNGDKKQLLWHGLLGLIILGVELFWISLITIWLSSTNNS